MNTNKLHPRFAARRLKEALADTPVVLIHGPRQCGKTTLARLVGNPLGYSYFSFDDPVLAGAAEADPIIIEIVFVAMTYTETIDRNL